MKRQAALNKKWCFSDHSKDCDDTCLLVLEDTSAIDPMHAVLYGRDAKGLMLKTFHLSGSTAAY